MVQVHSIQKLTLKKKTFNKNPSSFRHSEENRYTSFLPTRRNHGSKAYEMRVKGIPFNITSLILILFII